jgi:7 Permeases of the drug/metabolite transporter (DMT) superfamily
LIDLLGVGAALAAAAIWALVIFLYERHMESLDAAAVNFSRLLYVAVLLAPTALFIEPAPGLWAAVVSGVVTLFVGDSLYFYAIHKVGGSVAAPLAYTYIVMVQYFALLLGEEVSQWLILSSLLAVAGVSLLAGGGGARLSPLGLAAAAAAALLWSLGMTAVKLAVLGNVNPLAVAYLRAASACAALGLYLAAKRRLRVVKSPLFAAAALMDLGAGSALFAYAVGKIGLALTTILVSASPLITQLYAKATGVENLTPRQMAGAAAIFAAVLTAVGSTPSATPP